MSLYKYQRSNEYMNLYEYQRSRSFIDLGPDLSDSILNFFSSITTCRLKPYLIWSLLGLKERKLVQMVQVTWPRWPPCWYLMKTLLRMTTFTFDYLPWYLYSVSDNCIRESTLAQWLEHWIFVQATRIQTPPELWNFQQCFIPSLRLLPWII